MDEFATTFKSARLAAGLTQQKLSDLTEIPKRTIEEWEGGRRKPPAYVARLVLAELNRLAQQKQD